MLLVVSSVILFLQFLGEVSRGNRDVFCRPVCADHVAEPVILELHELAGRAPVFDALAAALDFTPYGNREIGADVADILEVEWLVFLIFHAQSVSWAQKKNQKKIRLGKNFFKKNA